MARELMKMASPLTSKEKRKIAKLAREGLSAREIARQLGGRSHTTVATCMAGLGALARAPGNAVGAPTHPEPSVEVTGHPVIIDASEGQQEPPGDLTMAEVRKWVSSQMRDLQAEARRCEMGQDPDGAATARRMLTAIAPLAARVALKDPADDGEVVRVKSSDMDAAAGKGREKLQDMLTKALAERAGWPRCAECGQPVRPAEGGES